MNFFTNSCSTLVGGIEVFNARFLNALKALFFCLLLLLIGGGYSNAQTDSSYSASNNTEIPGAPSQGNGQDDDDDDSDDDDNDDDDDDDDDNGNNQVAICHQLGNGGSITIYVNENAVQAHLNHGDYLGVCDDGGNYEQPCELALHVLCPQDVTVECGQEGNFDHTGTPEVSGEFCDEDLHLNFEDVVISCGPCGKVISRTWIITLGTITEVCTQIITSQDTQGPEIIGLESEINVQCLEGIPGFQEVNVVDACSGDGSIQNWSSQTGATKSECVASTAFGPGADWAVWLPTLSSAAGANFVFNADGGHFDQFADGTAHLHGTVVNTVDASEQFIVDLWFEDKADWAAWSGQGRGYKNDLLLSCATDNHQNWSYYELVGGFSTLTGAGALEGTELYLYHMPASYYFGFQIGVGANNKNCENGMSGWFTYEGFMGAQAISGHGDVNVDLQCEDINLGDCIHNTSFTYFYRGVDGCGHASIASQQIIVNDTTAPVFTNCPESFTMECSEPAVPVAQGIEAIDNCSGEVTIAYLGEVAEGNACLTTLTRTWSATDLCGNRSQCVQTITIVDTTAPVLNNLPEGEITVECDAVPAAAAVSIADNCDQNPALVYNEERIDGDCPSNYTLVRTWYGYDQCENYSATYTQTIHVQDTTAPVFDAYELYAHIECNQIPGLITASDNCGSATVEVIHETLQSGGCLGTLYRVYRATDECGNTSETEQFIAIMDTTAPEFVGLPSDMTVECSLSIMNDDGGVTGIDNCGNDVVITYSEQYVGQDDDCPETYDIIRTWVATDVCENQATATRTTHVQDTTAPVFVSFPSDLTISCDDEIPAVQYPTAVDNCDPEVEIAFGEATMPGSCPQNYFIYRTFRAYDNCGNETIETQTITVVDEAAPVFAEQNNQFTYECNTEIPVVTPEASDNCGQVSLDYSDSGSEGNSCYYTISRVWTATDECGNASHFTQYIHIQDTTAPVISGENQIYRPCDDHEGVFVNVSDNCNEYNVEYTDEMVSGSCAGNVIRHYFATDICGNVSAEFIQIIHLTDEVAPVIVSQTPNFTTECGGDSVGYSSAPILPGFFAPIQFGNQAIYLSNYATNFSGAQAQAAALGGQLVVIESASELANITAYIATYGQNPWVGLYQNTSSPQYSEPGGGWFWMNGNAFGGPWAAWEPNECTGCCGSPENGGQLYTNGHFNDLCVNANTTFVMEITLNGNAEVSAPVFADNCDNELLIDSTFTSSFDGCTTIETYTWTATDHCGNATTATTVVTIVDTTNPYFTALPEDVTVSCDNEIPGFGAYSAADNCDSDVTISVEENVIPGYCPQSYTLERVYRAVDNCGNQAVETRYVYVIDETAPYFGEENNQFTYECGQEIPVIEPSAYDNCGQVSLSYTDSEFEGTSCQRTIVRTWTASDECGNSSWFNQYITIIDTQAPVVNAYAPEVEMPCDAISNEIMISAEDCNEVIITFEDQHVSGTCAGRIIRTYYVSDVCGNQTEGLIQQIINLIDETAPTVAVAPVDVVIECGDDVPSYSPIWNDNCANQEDLIETAYEQITADSCTTVIYQTWTAVDPCENATTVSRTITIIDSTAPVFTYVPADENRDCSAEDVVANAYAEDICSDVTITHSDVLVPGFCAATYTIERTYTATDACGNYTSYTQTINVSDSYGPVWGENQSSFVYECGSDADVVTPVAYDNCSQFTVAYVDGEAVLNGCTSAFQRVWTAVDACGNASSPFVQYISFQDTTAPVLDGCPSDLVLNCNDEVPAPAQVSATDGCDDDVQVYYTQHILGDAPAEGSIADCNLLTPVRTPGATCGYPYDWAMAMFNMPSAHRWYKVVGGSLVQYPGGSLHLVAQLENVLTPGTGWNVNVWFNGGLDWAAWSTQSFPTSFKADCGGEDANFASWTYFLLQAGPGAELTGYGNYNGSVINLVHAPANNYFGFQLGDGANNYNGADNGFGGWFSYTGSFSTNGGQSFASVTGAGDFAFELDCCPDYQIVREWTAIDCSGNSSVCSQTISFSSEVAATGGNGGASTINNEAVSNERISSTIAVAPNPANSNALFTFKAAYAAKTLLEVFDMTGKKVADVFMGTVEAGASYNVNFNVSDLATGVYTYRLTNGSDVKIDRLIINK